MPGDPEIFIEEQASGWKKAVDAVHEKGDFIYSILPAVAWRAGYYCPNDWLTGNLSLCISLG